MSMLIDGDSPEKWLVVLDFIDKNLLCDPLLKKDIWHTINDMDANVNQHDKRLRISFENIQQDWLKLLVKLYILMENNRKIGVSTLTREVYCLSQFSKFINDKSIFIPNHINDQVFDEFDYHLKMSNLSQGSIAGYYNALRKFFNLCREEGWLEINTHWFKGRSNYSKPKNDEIEYIPEEIWRQLDEHLHCLPAPVQRMVLIIRGTGLRIGELLNLPFDCLRRRGSQWRLRLTTEKYQTVDEFPVCEELVIVIKEQQQFITKNFGDSYNHLFSSNSGRYYKPAPKIMASYTFNKSLNKLAKKENICTNEGKIWHFKSHQFRRTVSTVMTNAGVRDLIIQKYLRHRSPDIQNHYKHLLKEVLGEEYQELMKVTNYVNINGEIIAAHKPLNLVTEAVRRKMYQITTQYGECHRPILKSPCQTVNACLRCEYWLTSNKDLSALKQDIQRIEVELDIACKSGMIRQQQGLTTDRQNLMIRIEGLEKVNDKS